MTHEWHNPTMFEIYGISNDTSVNEENQFLEIVREEFILSDQNRTVKGRVDDVL